MAFIPYYMENILGVEKPIYGGVPYEISVYFVFSTIGSIFNAYYIQHHIEKHKNSRILMISFALLFTIFGTLPMIITSASFNYPIYLYSFILGIGISLALSIDSILTNDIVGNQGASSGAFVFAFYGLGDKVLVGVVIALLMEYIKDDYYWLKIFFPVFLSALILIGLILIFISNFLITKSKLEENDNLELLLDNSRLTFESVYE